MNMASAMLNTVEGAQPITEDSDPTSLTKIFSEACNLATWPRNINKNVLAYSRALLDMPALFQLKLCINISDLNARMVESLPNKDGREAFIDDLSLLAQMFGELMYCQAVGLRLAVLQKAMCPSFHVDRVPARLICTYLGEGTHWVAQEFRESQADAIGSSKLLLKAVLSGKLLQRAR